ncbi:hypothetical protein [Nocardioides jensenii]|uniref:hypothetical protein n=1 Tax=Nocardioides jensenii TaxID=1843 RepID=UPI000AB808FB|nr:hypothetical protein [Nocardioides jensenii]
MPRRRIAVLVTVLAALLLSGCSGDDEEEPLEALTPAERTVQTNPDRNADEVAERAGAIDPCALLRAVHPAGGVSRDAFPRADSPHSCWMTNSSVRADVFTPLSEFERFRYAREELAGVVSYRTGLQDGRCLIHLPISHDHAISFSGLASCATVTTYAEGAAEFLQSTPAKATRPPGINRISACGLLDHAGRVTGSQQLTTKYTVLDECGDEATGADFELEYEDDVVRDWQTTHTFGATTVRVQKTKERCYLKWTIGEADVTVREGHDLAGFITTVSCKKGLALAKALIPAAREVTSPDRDPVGLLYAWDEADTSAVGACSNIADQADLQCSPAEDADVPTNRRDLIMRAEADPDVLCAAATPLVQEHYGEALTPTTALAPSTPLLVAAKDPTEDATQCAFGTPSHALEISVAVFTGATSKGDADEEFDGRPARVSDDEVSRSYVVARDELGEPGFLLVEVRTLPSRWREIHDAYPSPEPVAARHLADADALVVDLAGALL